MQAHAFASAHASAQCQCQHPWEELRATSHELQAGLRRPGAGVFRTGEGPVCGAPQRSQQWPPAGDIMHHLIPPDSPWRVARRNSSAFAFGTGAASAHAEPPGPIADEP